ncbi:hypothetical protein A2U01_0072935 [Trifolium medium]|uniref:Uncharacterized protein n=1 Tax=Trifolium medium TaxID=97028 RepID=A0A392SS56_9FABA|nr:hypothetical protein [Trifolium medium]
MVSIMARVYPPIIDDCQSFSLNGGISSSCSSPWVKVALLIREPRMRTTCVPVLSGSARCSFGSSSTS